MAELEADSIAGVSEAVRARSPDVLVVVVVLLLPDDAGVALAWVAVSVVERAVAVRLSSVEALSLLLGAAALAVESVAMISKYAWRGECVNALINRKGNNS